MSRDIGICTISMDARIAGERSMDNAFSEIEKKVEKAASDSPDLFLLPEACLSGLADERLTNEDFHLKLGDAYCAGFAEIARRHSAYIAASVLMLRDGKRHNSTLLFDRSGEIAFIYDKAYPTAPELKAGIIPGPRDPSCFETDFGTLGFAICYDLNFRKLFENYHEQGMELLLFSTYFPGGRILANIAFDFSCFAVSSHAQGDESVIIDNFGREIARANMFVPALTRVLNLDSAVLPLSGNLDKIELIKNKYGRDVEIEIHRPEAKMILKSLSSNLSTKDLTAEFNLQTKLSTTDS